MSASEQGANATAGRWLTIPRTLCFVTNGHDVLLMKRAPHRRVFPNRYNGVGGHIERDEDPLHGAIREMREETGLTVHDVRLRAVYNIDANEATGIVLFVFTAVSTHRDITVHSEEGTLHWIPCDKVLTLDLVEDLPEILPRVLAMQSHDAPLFVHVSYDANDRLCMRFAEPV
ncbi:MAG: NUDIX domain-containing protein [Candidatus Tectomicrobia bacterium]|uniref:NUDIX domain-containing protein n=1 Tax=Tectimicrobiota bacterium TaxID=2528274 RepID=A0A937VYE0_UNCTE|nr:NUDIX domain-containing protein [Candidatus Tectomicrobia bacterium]